jgi:NAD(P)H-dependent flavin oxidoreductase YrpB (nitropropane dioxygenase family)
MLRSQRGTFTLVPEVADLISALAPETLLCAAGGVADGRGLAAAIRSSFVGHEGRYLIRVRCRVRGS